MRMWRLLSCKIYQFILMYCLFLNGISGAIAASTQAGVLIENQAILQYQIDQTALVTHSNLAKFYVSGLLDVSLESLDSQAVSVASPDRNQVLTFKLTNLSNMPTQFFLNPVWTGSGDDFNPIPSGQQHVFLENGRLFGLQMTGAALDTHYQPNEPTPTLQPNQSLIVYVVADIPENQPAMAKGMVELQTTSIYPSALNLAMGDVLVEKLMLKDAQNQPIEMEVIKYHASAFAVGWYQVGGIQVLLNKQVVSVNDPFGGNSIESGSKIRYLVEVRVQGSGHMEQVQIRDPLPATLNYVPNSSTLNGQPFLDAPLVIVKSQNNEIWLELGALIAPTVYRFEFDVMVVD